MVSMNTLSELQKLVDELNESNSVLAKKEVLKKYPQCKKILSYVYSPFLQYNITSKNLQKRNDLVEDTDLDLFELLDKLSSREITGHKALAITNGFIQQNSQYSELIYNIIDKNLKTRTDAKVINAVFPKTVDQFNVQLADSFDKNQNRVDFDKDTWYSSRKLDGVRCLAIIDGTGDISLLSRAGKEFETLGKIEEELKSLHLINVVFDGEVCLVDENGNEDFQSVIKEIRRKNHTIESPKFKVFDVIDYHDFLEGKGKKKFSDRYEFIPQYLGGDLKHVERIEQIIIENTEHLLSMADDAVESGWEGLIIRKDVPYEGKRSKNMLKVKKFYDAEYVVNDVEMGPFRVIIDGKEVTEEMLSAVMIEHKENVVRVGSGFSIDQRRQYYKDPSQILGKTMTVQYFEETIDQNGLYSLRFPTVKAIYDNGRDM